MSRVKRNLPWFAGIVALAISIAALIIATTQSSTKTVTTVISGSSSGAAVPTSTASSSGGGLSVNQIYKQDINGVVDIDVTSVTPSSGNSGSFPFGGGGGSQEEQGEGAGVVYDNKGDIVTDEHVVAGATKVTVHFEDGYSAPAKVLGTDSSTDMAVIHVSVPASELHPIPFANSDDAQVGDAAVAIGSPFGSRGRPRPASSAPPAAASRRRTATRSATRSRPTPLSTRATRAVRCLTPRATCWA